MAIQWCIVKGTDGQTDADVLGRRGVSGISGRGRHNDVDYVALLQSEEKNVVCRVGLPETRRGCEWWFAQNRAGMICVT